MAKQPKGLKILFRQYYKIIMLNNFFVKTLNRINPNFIWNLYSKKCKKIFNKSYFILSFDCDTEEDIAVALEVHLKLKNIGVTPVYAVPGKLLRIGAQVYRNIFEMGSEFINHGGKKHTYFDTLHNRHASCFFYDQQSLEILKQDIIEGHKILLDVLGITATGWRTPHFGTYQKREHFNFLYSILKEMNYKFSTSSCPALAYKHGPIYQNKDIIEVPVTGIFSEPLNIMDTWAYFGAPDRIKTPKNYLETAKKLSQFSGSHPILINIYGDPSHIYDKPEFFEAMKMFAEASENVNYSQLLEITYENLRSV